MKIDSYKYGSITVDGKNFSRDLIIFPGWIKMDWWRKDGHVLNIEDLVEVFAAGPEVLIIGTGESGFMDVPESTRTALADRKIEVVAERSGRAVKLFNKKARSGKKVIGAFHLTC